MEEPSQPDSTPASQPDIKDHLYQKPVSSDFSNSTFDCNTEGFAYVAGYYAHKFKSEYPELGIKTCDAQLFGQDSSVWITALSRGGLTKPSNKFLSILKNFEDIFDVFHGSTINPCQNVITSLIKLIQSKHPEVPLSVVKKYSRTRTFIRIKNLNRKINQEAFRKRNEKQLKQFKL